PCGLLRGAGKSPVVINREIDGFIGNRLQFALLREAWALWADEVASASAIDAVVRQSIGRRLGITGPLESADLGGIETMVSFAKFLLPTLDVSNEPPERVTALNGALLFILLAAIAITVLFIRQLLAVHSTGGG